MLLCTIQSSHKRKSRYPLHTRHTYIDSSNLRCALTLCVHTP